MDIRVTEFSLVSNFLDNGFEGRKITDALQKKVSEIMQDNHQIIPNDWVLLFQACYNNSRTLLVSKNRLGTYPSDKMKYVKIVIPIPLQTEITWGVDPDQHTYNRDHYDRLMRNFRELSVNIKSFSNRNDYVESCLKVGINDALKEGFTVGKTKIQINNPGIV